MNCLTDYIGLKGCSTVEPESGLFINSLPGITLESMDRIATAEQITYKGVWADVQEEAYQEFDKMFFAELLKCYTIDKCCDYTALICDNKEKLSVAWRYLLGSTLMVYRRYSDRLNYFTTITLEDAKELIDLYNKKFKEALSKAIKIIDVSSCHLHCGGDPEVVTMLP